MSLSELERKETQEVAELEVRRYFDHYLENVYPTQLAAHNNDATAHGGVSGKVNKIMWVAAGAAAIGGGVTKLLAFIGAG